MLDRFMVYATDMNKNVFRVYDTWSDQYSDKVYTDFKEAVVRCELLNDADTEELEFTDFNDYA